MLAIHPPILYLGYVGSSLFFSSSLAAITKIMLISNWAKNLKNWVIISWILLTIGIMLDSIWAYMNWVGEDFGFGIQLKIFH